MDWNSKNRWCFAVPKTNTAGTGKLQARDYTWRLVMPRGYQVEAMALCASGLAVAGRVYNPKSDEPRGFFRLVSLEDGRKLAEIPLDSSPAYDGLAVADQQAYIALDHGNLICFGT